MTWVDGNLEEPEFCAFAVRDQRVDAFAGWKRDHRMALAIGLITDRHDWTVEEYRQANGEEKRKESVGMIDVSSYQNTAGRYNSGE